jgi:hypothetical protein
VQIFAFGQPEARRAGLGHSVSQQDDYIQRRKGAVREIGEAACGVPLGGAAQVLEDVGLAVGVARSEKSPGDGRRSVPLVGQEGGFARGKRARHERRQRAPVRAEHRGVLPGDGEPSEGELHRADVRLDLYALAAEPPGQVGRDAEIARVARSKNDRSLTWPAGAQPVDERVQVGAHHEALGGVVGEET